MSLSWGGAAFVTLIGFRLVLTETGPVFDAAFDAPKGWNLNARLFIGAGIFSAGWGFAGFCAGGLLPALGTLDTKVIMLMATLIFGMLSTRFVMDWAMSYAHPSE